MYIDTHEARLICTYKDRVIKYMCIYVNDIVLILYMWMYICTSMGIHKGVCVLYVIIKFKLSIV